MKQFLRLISISLPEVVAASLLLGFLTVYVLYGILMSDGNLLAYIYTYEGDAPLMQQYWLVRDSISANDFVGSFSVFAFWSIVGLLAYYLFYYLFLSEREAEAFFRELRVSIGNARVAFLEYEFIRVGIRIAAIIGIVACVVLFQQVLLPYGMVVFTITDALPDVARLLYMVLAAGIIVLYLHLCVVLLRALLLQERVFL